MSSGAGREARPAGAGGRDDGGGGVSRLKVSSLILGTVGVLFAALIVGLVVSSLVRPEVATFVPTPPAPAEVGPGSVGPRTYTVDARSHEDWVHFDFSRGSVVQRESEGSLDWDIAFRRHRMITNGGGTNRLGRAGVLDLGETTLEAGVVLPVDGYVVDERRGDEPRNRVLEDWYEYSWISHLLRPTDKTYALRTANGEYALLRFLSYYCPGGQAGCVTFRYRYRGDGSRRLTATEPTG